MRGLSTCDGRGVILSQGGRGSYASLDSFWPVSPLRNGTLGTQMDPVNAMLGTTEVTHKGKLDSLSIPENL